MCRSLLCCLPCRRLCTYSAAEFGLDADNGFAAHDVAAQHRRMSLFWFLVGVCFAMFLTAFLAAVAVFVYGSALLIPDAAALLHATAPE